MEITTLLQQYQDAIESMTPYRGLKKLSRQELNEIFEKDEGCYIRKYGIAFCVEDFENPQDLSRVFNPCNFDEEERRDLKDGYINAFHMALFRLDIEHIKVNIWLAYKPDFEKELKRYKDVISTFELFNGMKNISKQELGEIFKEKPGSFFTQYGFAFNPKDFKDPQQLLPFFNLHCLTEKEQAAIRSGKFNAHHMEITRTIGNPHLVHVIVWFIYWPDNEDDAILKKYEKAIDSIHPFKDMKKLSMEKLIKVKSKKEFYHGRCAIAFGIDDFEEGEKLAEHICPWIYFPKEDKEKITKHVINAYHIGLRVVKGRRKMVQLTVHWASDPLVTLERTLYLAEPFKHMQSISKKEMDSILEKNDCSHMKLRVFFPLTDIQEMNLDDYYFMEKVKTGDFNAFHIESEFESDNEFIETKMWLARKITKAEEIVEKLKAMIPTFEPFKNLKKLSDEEFEVCVKESFWIHEMIGKLSTYKLNRTLIRFGIASTIEELDTDQGMLQCCQFGIDEEDQSMINSGEIDAYHTRFHINKEETIIHVAYHLVDAKNLMCNQS